MHSSPLRCVALVVSVLVFAMAAQSASALDQEVILHNFQVNGVDGGTPQGGLVFDSAGNLYGTTNGGGANFKGSIFELSPPATAGGDWTETVLYSFIGGVDGPGQNPVGTLLIDAKGNLYGTAEGQPGGVIFELSPPAMSGGSWNYQVLYSFCSVMSGSTCTDGAVPAASLIKDNAGNLYGTTESGGAFSLGTVFELTPSASLPWTEHVLYNFCSNSVTVPCADGSRPTASLIFDSNGNLYGTTFQGGLASSEGVVFELSPPATAGGVWTEQVLHAFPTSLFDGSIPVANLVIDSNGNLYGTTETSEDIFTTPPGNYGTVFELSPPVAPSTTWTETILHYFTGPPTTASNDGGGPESGLIFDGQGNLYGTTLSGGPNIDTQQGTTGGTVYEMSPPAKSGGAWTIQYLYDFAANSTDAFETAAGVIFDGQGNLYGTTQAGGTNNAGTVFELLNAVEKLTPMVQVSPAATSITTAQSLEVTITVSGGSGNPTPTGTVTLSSGSYNSGATALVGGSAMITIPAGALAVGMDTLAGSYSGDSNYNGAMNTTIVDVSLPPPPPTISSLSPFVATAGGTAFTLTVNGTNFASGAVVNWGSTGLTTSFVNPTQLTAPVSAPLIAAAGSVEVTVTLGGETSAPALFTITANGTFPQVLSLSPSSATAGGAQFTLTVDGANFVSNAVVLWNGAKRTTTYVSGTQLKATILAADILAEGTNLVTVVKPGVGTSAAQPFAVLAVTPVLGSVSLANTADLSGDRLLTLTGTNFVSTSSVEWGTTALAATFLDPWTITAVVTASEHAALPVTVTVTNGSSASNGIVVQ